jgi:hypothetical protein
LIILSCRKKQQLKTTKNINNMAKTTTKTATATPGLSLFAAAKNNAATTKKPGKDRRTVEVKGYENKIDRHLELKTIMEDAKAELAIIDGEIKEKATGEYLKIYKSEGRVPENFYFKSGSSQLMFGVMDKYIKVTDEKKELLEKLEPSVLEETTEYAFNGKLLEKYADIISEAIQGIDKKKMSDADKSALIVATTTTTIKKGTVKSLTQYGGKLEEVFEMIQPISFLKDGGDEA